MRKHAFDLGFRHGELRERMLWWEKERALHATLGWYLAAGIVAGVAIGSMLASFWVLR